jgi:hypothetical protein
MDSSKIKLILILGLALLFSLYLGVAAATAQLEAVIWVAGGVFLAVCFALGRHVWILIPMTMGMKGGLNFIPGSPTPWQLMTAVVAGILMLRILMRTHRVRYRWTGMDTAVLLVALTILQAFLRNPTGVALLGGDLAGGKPYFVFGVALVAFAVISLADADFRSWKWAVSGYVLFSLVDALINLVSGLSPAFATLMIRFYSNVSIDAATQLGYQGDAFETRISQFAQLGGVLSLIACSYWRPLAALDFTKPWRAVIALGGILATLLSGFRGAVAMVVVYFVVGSTLRRKPLDAVVIGILGLLVAAIVVLAVPASSLPYSVQRVFSVIPGYARGDISTEAQDSKDLRFEMWQLALSGDRFIRNKTLGDGFQFTAAEFRAREAMRLGDYQFSGGMTTIEMMMITGSYHGFHVETIRFTGVVGLLAATGALIVFAVFASRCIRAYRGQAGWGHVIFFCMPFLIHPLWYWLVFGNYRGDFAALIATAGMVKLLYLNRGLESVSQLVPSATPPLVGQIPRTPARFAYRQRS